MEIIDCKDPLYHCVETEVFDIWQDENGHTTRAKVIYPFNYYGQKHKEYPEKFPVLFFVQGSGWFHQNLGLESAQLVDYARHGMAVIILGYRDSSIGKFPTQIQDVMRSIHFFMTTKTEYPLDVTKVIIAGDSSGGHTAMMTAYQLCRYYPMVEPSSIKGVIDYYGALDLKGMLLDHGFKKGDRIADDPIGHVLGMDTFDPEDPVFIESSVFTMLERSTYRFPLVIVHGEDDPIIPVSQSDQLEKLALSLDMQVNYFKVKNAVHGGDIIFGKTITNKIITIIDSWLNQ